ncbi:MAG: glycoside hydrolase family 88 protein, partial [Opitutales bacterium]
MKIASVVSLGTLLLLAGAGLLRAADAPPAQFNGSTPLQWSERMAQSQIARLGSPPKPRWDYTTGLFALSLIKLSEQTGNTTYRDFGEQLIAPNITADGNITGYKPADYTLDSINPGKVVLELYERTHDPRYQKAAALLRQQLATQPRTSDGGFWHKQIYPHQMWLDGLYMASPFYAQYGQIFNEPADFDDVVKQITLIDSHTYDPKTGLFYHGWDESRTQNWADPQTGHSPSFWGRAIGWYAMTLVDVLDFLPAYHPGRVKILDILNRLAAGLARYQDQASGLWWQVVDQGGREGNYLEASASSMFVDALAKAVNHGYLPHDLYQPVILKGYAGLINTLVKVDPQGQVSLTQICETAGLSNGRDGSYAYYLREKIVANDAKGVGPFILAGIEVNNLLASSTPAPSAPADTSASPNIIPGPNAPIPPAPPASWDDVPAILARIHAPTFPDRDFLITDYGAVAGGDTDCTDAIAKAIAACNAAGGGHVIVPDGVFLTGAVHLLSNVDLHLADNATLKFSPDPNKYLPIVFTRFESTECMNYSPLIFAYKQQNIAVTGNGTLDGSGNNTTWWVWAHHSGSDSKTLVSASDRGVPPEQRIFGPGHFLRPNFIVANRCQNVLIANVTIHNSPMWEINPVLSTNIIVRGVNISSLGPNNDGCDPESSKDILIENCTFQTGDDCIAIKSGRNDDGRRVGVASENIIVRNCHMLDGHGGVVIGSEISGNCRNVFAENCQMDSPNLNCVLRFKSNAVRGGILENVFMRNIQVGKVAKAALLIEFNYQEGANGPYRPVLRNITMDHITGQQIPRVVELDSIPAAIVQNILIENSSFSGLKSPEPLVNTDAITYQNVTIQSDRKPKK